jgi:hypothetical protein
MTWLLLLCLLYLACRLYGIKRQQRQELQPPQDIVVRHLHLHVHVNGDGDAKYTIR